MEKKFYIKTYGCQMNELDGMQMGRLLKQHGYLATENPEDASLILINTCSVREKASQKVYSDIGRFRALKLRRPETVLGVTGCQAQAEGPFLLKRFPYLDLVVGPDHVAKTPDLVSEIAAKRRSSTALAYFEKREDYRFLNLLPDEEENQVKAFITIMKGCDNFCSFCVVPMVRGREVCREPEEIIAEARALAERGVREITLLGQNVNSYGVGRHAKDGGRYSGKYPMLSFAKLLRRIGQESEIERIRFTTSHPKDLSDELIDEFRANPKLAMHFHLPVQSGSDRILEKMYRGYSVAEYHDRVRQLREAAPEIAISSDVIVGFPTETEADFEATMDLIRKVGYDSIYSFVYSPRPKTTAALYFEDDIPLEVKKERLHRLQAEQDRITLERHREKVGKDAKVLVEGPSKQGSTYCGRSSQNQAVHFMGDENDVGKILDIRIVQAGPNSLMGEKRV